MAERDLSNQKLTARLSEREKEDALLQSKEHYRKVIENVHDVIYEIDNQGYILYISPSVTRVVGFTAEEVIGKNFIDFVGEAAKTLGERLAMLKEVDEIENEYRIRKKNGDPVWIRLSTKARRENGVMVGGTGTLIDITEKKLVELELAKSEALYRSILQASPDVITITNLEGTIQLASPKAYDMFGYDPQTDFHNRSIIEFIDPRDHGQALEAISDMIKGNFFGASEYRGLRADGTSFDIEVNGQFIRNNEGKPVSMVFVTRDISERKKTEVRLSRTEERYRKLVENINDAIYEVDNAATILYVSPSIERIVGFKPEELIGKNFFNFMYPDDRPILLEALSNLGKKDFSFLEYRYYAKDGSLRWVRSSTKPIIDNGEMVGGIGSLTDITDRKRDEEELLKLSRAVEQSPVSIVITNLEGNIEYANPKATETTGYQLHELIGKNPRVLKSGETPSDEYENLWGTITHGDNWHGIFHNKRKNGEMYWESSTISPITDLTGKITHFLAVKEDVTEKKLAEQQIKKLSLAVEQSPVSIVITDLEANIEYVNPAFTQTSGYALDEVIGKNTNILKSGLTDRKLYDELWESIEKGSEWSGEWINKRKNGELYWESISISPIHDERGRIRNYLAIKQDISERKSTEKEIRELNATLEERIGERTRQLSEANETLRNARLEAEQANLAKSEFLSRMSHELRTPMNSILGFAQLLEMGELSAVQKKGVTHIIRSGRHLLDLINEVLDISRIEAGRLSLSLEPVQIDLLVNEMTETIQPQAVERHIHIEFPDRPENRLYVKADRQRLKQVVLNLLSNAVKYNIEGGWVKIETSIRPNPKGNEQLRVSVADSGIGISASDLPKLFTPFERIGADKTETEGTGLGLSVVKKLMEAMGGFMGVDSEPGKGSTFWIELPVIESQVDSARNMGLMENQEELPAQKHGTILYIEDNTSNIDLVEQLLANHRPGIGLVTDIYGKNAVGMARKHHPDLILLDLNLPDIHGSEVLCLLKAEESTRNIPVVIITADAMQSQSNRLIKAGARNYLTKPIDVQLLLQVIDEITTK